MILLNIQAAIKYLPACNFCNGRSHDATRNFPAIQAKVTYLSKSILILLADVHEIRLFITSYNDEYTLKPAIQSAASLKKK